MLLFFRVPNQLWDVLRVINTLRNDLAHNLESPKFAGHVASARAIAQQLLPEQPPPSPGFPNLDTDVGVLRYLVVFAEACLRAIDIAVAAMETPKKNTLSQR